MKIDWVKCPSVWTGGKPYFWTGVTSENHQRLWAVWDRLKLCWIIDGECPKGGTITFKDGFKTAKSAMKWADENI